MRGADLSHHTADDGCEAGAIVGIALHWPW
jgi:hypothetical protein